MYLDLQVTRIRFTSAMHVRRTRGWVNDVQLRAIISHSSCIVLHHHHASKDRPKGGTEGWKPIS